MGCLELIPPRARAGSPKGLPSREEEVAGAGAGWELGSAARKSHSPRLLCTEGSRKTVWGPSGRQGPSGSQGRQNPDNLAKPGFPQRPSLFLRATIPRPGSPGVGSRPLRLPQVPSGPQSPGLAGEQVPTPTCLCTWKWGGISRLPSCLSPASLLPFSLLCTGPPQARRRPGGTQPSGRTWPAPSSSFQWAPAGPRWETRRVGDWGTEDEDQVILTRGRCLPEVQRPFAQGPPRRIEIEGVQTALWLRGALFWLKIVSLHHYSQDRSCSVPRFSSKDKNVNKAIFQPNISVSIKNMAIRSRL